MKAHKPKIISTSYCTTEKLLASPWAVCPTQPGSRGHPTPFPSFTTPQSLWSFVLYLSDKHVGISEPLHLLFLLSGIFPQKSICSFVTSSARSNLSPHLIWYHYHSSHFPSWCSTLSAIVPPITWLIFLPPPLLWNLSLVKKETLSTLFTLMFPAPRGCTQYTEQN